MRKLATLIICAGALAATAAAQPAVNLIQNNYGWMLPGTPNYGIAQGSIFTIIGTNLGPATLAKAPDLTATTTLPTSLGGVTVTVAVPAGGQALPVPLYYASATAVSGVLPSNTPVGDGTLTITYNGQSTTAPIHVVQRAFGILALNGGGSGTVVGQNYTASATAPPLVGFNQVAHPNDTIVIYGSGLGASSNDTGLNNDVVNWAGTIPVTVWVGGQQVTPDYAGRSAYYPGLDQINFKMPANVQGCNVSMYVQTGSGASATVSNTVTIPVASTGSTCSDPGGLSSADIAAMGAGGFKLGVVSLSRFSFDLGAALPGFPSTFTTDSGFGDFTQLASAGGVAYQNPFQASSVGSCTVVAQTSTSAPNVSLQGTGLDAGPQIGVSGPKGDKTLPATTDRKGLYSATLSGDNPLTGTPYLDPGAYTITGPGGTDVGGFTMNLAVPAALTWTNSASVTTVTRANGQTVTWTGGDPTGLVEIYGASSAGENGPNVVFICTAQNTANGGSFTIPAGVLLQLPASAGNAGGVPSGFMALGSTAVVRSATTPTGLDALYGQTTSLSGKAVTYQ